MSFLMKFSTIIDTKYIMLSTEISVDELGRSILTVIKEVDISTIQTMLYDTVHVTLTSAGCF